MLPYRKFSNAQRQFLEKVIALYVAPKNGKRIKKETIEVDPKGVIEDKFYGKEATRSILLTSLLSYEDAKSQEIALALGELSENIIISGDPFTLKVGDRIKIGQVLFEVASPGTLCKGLKKIHPRLPKVVAKRRGIYIKALEKGVVYVGDAVVFNR